MKKLFGREKAKMVKVTHASRELVTGTEEQHPQYSHQHLQYAPQSANSFIPPPLPAQAVPPSSSDDRWEVVSTSNVYEESPAHALNPPAPPLSISRSGSYTSLPPGASPPIPGPHVPRSGSPFAPTPPAPSTPYLQSNVTGTRERDNAQTLKKKPPLSPATAVGIRSNMDPQSQMKPQKPQSSPAIDNFVRTPPPERESSFRDDKHAHHREGSNKEDKKDKKSFTWSFSDKVKGGEKEKERGPSREKERGEEPALELTRMIGYSTASSVEDWALALEICQRSSLNEASAKEAVTALKKEFKYGEPASQLSAARLWAIMLRNSSEIFVSQCMSKKFLDALEDLIVSSKTSPVVRERVMEILAAAAYAQKGKSTRHDKDGFRGLWRKLKPADKPEEGMPFDMVDAMFTPPVQFRSTQHTNDGIPHSVEQLDNLNPANTNQHGRKRKTSISTNRIIPVEEDIRRLFEECKIGQGNAALLSEALAFAKPKDLSKNIIREFYMKCRTSQELIFAQIPWASAGAERSRLESGRPPKSVPLSKGDPDLVSSKGSDEDPIEPTTEEQLLAALLEANEELLEALRVYNDLERVGAERMVEERSRKEIGVDQTAHNLDVTVHNEIRPSNIGDSSPSTSPTNSPTPPPIVHSTSYGHPLPLIPSKLDTIHPDISHSSISSAAALAPPPPAPHGPRSPAQLSQPSRTPSPELSGGVANGSLKTSLLMLDASHQNGHVEAIKHFNSEASDTQVKPSAKALGKRKVVEAGQRDLGEVLDSNDEPFADVRIDSDSDSGHNTSWHRRPVHYVYDAAAERTQERLVQLQLVNGVH